jgi:hypothetical protein
LRLVAEKMNFAEYLFENVMGHFGVPVIHHSLKGNKKNSMV